MCGLFELRRSPREGESPEGNGVEPLLPPTNVPAQNADTVTDSEREHSTDHRIEDCADLLGAVIARLQSLDAHSHAAEAADGAQSLALAAAEANRMRGDVLDCALALNQLQHALAESHPVAALPHPAKHNALAMHDLLTSLPNRLFFREQAGHALAHAVPERHHLAVLRITLDGMTSINQMRGHDAGDEMLRILADRLAGAVGAEDVVSRQGGVEFVCLLTDCADEAGLRELVARLSDSVSAPVKLGKFNLAVRPVIGIASYPGDGTTLKALLKHAAKVMRSQMGRKRRYVAVQETPDS